MNPIDAAFAKAEITFDPSTRTLENGTVVYVSHETFDDTAATSVLEKVTEKLKELKVNDIKPETIISATTGMKRIAVNMSDYDRLQQEVEKMKQSAVSQTAKASKKSEALSYEGLMTFQAALNSLTIGTWHPDHKDAKTQLQDKLKGFPFKQDTIYGNIKKRDDGLYQIEVRSSDAFSGEPSQEITLTEDQLLTIMTGVNELREKLIAKIGIREDEQFSTPYHGIREEDEQFSTPYHLVNPKSTTAASASAEEAERKEDEGSPISKDLDILKKQFEKLDSQTSPVWVHIDRAMVRASIIKLTEYNNDNVKKSEHKTGITEALGELEKIEKSPQNMDLNKVNTLINGIKEHINNDSKGI